ncbi:MAG: phytanoyl-CoA dioxygenase family protein [Halobacteriovoraceae bacterium]|nr:phytanoyl-CoA dioxygenase family protein [Halobacteriovoraceae bacterium]
MLSSKQLEEFDEIGYLLIKQVFLPSEITEMSQAFDRIYSNSKKLNPTIEYQEFNGTQFVFENGHLHRAVWVGANENILLKYSQDKRILNIVGQILESNEFNQLVNQAHFKIPGDNIEFEWHQDSQHRGYGTKDWEDINGKGSYLQTAIAIDPMTKKNGPLEFIPGVHKNGHVYLDKVANPFDFFDKDKSVTIEMDPGDLAIFGPYSIHSSRPNYSDQTRRIFINGYAYPGANKRKYPGNGSGRKLFV